MSAAKHQAKKVQAGSYLYRGYRVERVEDFVSSDYGTTQWNIFESDAEDAGDCTETLSGAKYLIDRIIGSKES